MKNKLFWMVLLAIGLAIAAGWTTGTTMGIGGVTFYQIYELMGKVFLNALTLVVIPLVASSIITGIARIGAESSFGRLGGKTFSFFFLNILCAVLLGWSLMMIFDPAAVSMTSEPVSINTAQIAKIECTAQQTPFYKFEQIFLQAIPSNILAAASQGQMLGIIFFSLLFGFFISRIETQAGSALLNFWQGVFQVMMKFTQFVMKALPFGVFFLVAKVVATTGFEAFSSVATFFLLIVGGLAFHCLITLPVLLKVIGRVNPILHLKAMGPAILTAFSTSSSSATLPTTLECLEKRAGVSNRICSIVIPLGTSINMAGSAFYTCASAIFIAQAYGVEMSVSTQCLIMFLAVVTAIGIAGIPSACLIALVVILGAIGVPVEGIGLIFAIERILDMCRAATNVFGNSCCAVLVARSEGEKTRLNLK